MGSTHKALMCWAQQRPHHVEPVEQLPQPTMQQPPTAVLDMADESQAQGIVRGRGSAKFLCRDTDEKLTDIVLRNVLYKPSFPHNIISVRKGNQHGMTFTFAPNGAQIVVQTGASLNLSICFNDEFENETMKISRAFN